MIIKTNHFKETERLKSTFIKNLEYFQQHIIHVRFSQMLSLNNSIALLTCLYNFSLLTELGNHLQFSLMQLLHLAFFLLFGQLMHHLSLNRLFHLYLLYHLFYLLLFKLLRLLLRIQNELHSHQLFLQEIA